MPSSPYRKKLIEGALPLEAIHEMFDRIVISCYSIATSPLFLREQGARRPKAASAFLNPGNIQHRMGLQEGK